ncbi:8509_t:CDS:1, partial [Gigaspora margarita]
PLNQIFESNLVGKHNDMSIETESNSIVDSELVETKPSYSQIVVGNKNNYGHKADSTVNKFKQRKKTWTSHILTKLIVLQPKELKPFDTELWD